MPFLSHVFVGKIAPPPDPAARERRLSKQKAPPISGARMLATFEKITYSSPQSLQSQSKPTEQPAPLPASHFSLAYLAGPSCRKIAYTPPVALQSPTCCPSPDLPPGTPSSSRHLSCPVPAPATGPESCSAHSTPASSYRRRP